MHTYSARQYQPDWSQGEYVSGKDIYRVMNINNKS